MRRALEQHWPEYLAEALGLGLFMISACVFGTLLGHPGSPVARAIPDGLPRRLLMGLAMGSTAVALIYSPWGRRSGAHLNPATTLTFWRLDKVAGPDAAWYVLAQALGGVAGVLAAALVVGPAFTGIFAGALVATYIAFESPVSGMSMNPARSLASALPAGAWDVLWIYFLAPPIGMLLAAELYVRRHGLARVFCAKLHHDGESRCIFRCRFGDMQAERPAMTSTAGAASRAA